MELEEKIAEYVRSLLTETHFLVEVRFSEKGRRARLTVLIDGDKGVNVDYCAEVSRRLAAWLEEQDLIKNAYVLEVSSPGVGQPLKLKRQYHANIGRILRVDTVGGTTHKGKLVRVSDETVWLAPLPAEKSKKAPKKEQPAPAEPLAIPFAEIAKAAVEISFD